MIETPRSRLLRRARTTTVGIVVTAAAGTAALTAVAAHATAQGGSGGTTGITGRSSGGSSGSPSTPHRSTGLVPAPSYVAPQGGTNAS